MTKLEQLKAAHAASTQGAWVLNANNDITSGKGSIAWLPAEYATQKPNAEAIALAHNMMPDLLETVELLGVALHALETPGDFTAEEMSEQVIGDIASLLEKLKEPSTSSTKENEV